MDVQFRNLASLHWLWLLLVVAAVVVIGLGMRRRRLLRFATAAVLSRLAPSASPARRGLRFGMLIAAMLMLVVALLDPRWGISYEEVQQQGIDLVVVLDVSRSMLAEDVRPDRLERARQYVVDLLEAVAGDRVGLIVFAGSASVACPLTVDYGAVRLSLMDADPRLVGRGGSLIGDALRLAEDAFTDEIKDFKAVVLLTDGEDHGSYPVEAARRLHEELGARVYTVGLGDGETGARIPVEQDGQRVFLTHEGQEVWSKMDAALLRDVALAGGGAFLPVGTGTVDLGRVYTERIAPATKRQFGSTRIERHHVRYQWFAGIALVLLLIESLITDRRAAGPRLETALS